jgi:Ca2+-binding RTX toxin-like protein
VEAFNVTTGVGNDTIKLKGRFNDTLKTQDGDDIISSSLGYDTIDGGSGNDLLILDYSANNYSGINTSFNSGNGYFYAYYQSGNPYDRVDFSNIEKFQITGTQVNDSITTGNSNDTIGGGSGNDTINTSDGNDTIDGGSGNDTISAGGGNDVLKGGSGDDTLDAGFGNDSIDGGDGTDLLIDDFSGITTAVTLDNTGASIVAPTGTTISNVEAFNVTTGVGNDTIKLKGRFNDTLKTQDGDDIISSGLGYDTIDGGSGNDLLILDYSANNYSGINTSFNSGNGYFYAYYQSGNPYDRVDFSNIEKFQITGTQVNDSITTGNGNDTLISGGRNDTLDAGGGNDILIGVDPSSSTAGRGELDYLTGGNGNDLFVLGDGLKFFYDDGRTNSAGLGDYADIKDFNSTQDIIQLQGSSTNYFLAVSGSDTQLYFNKPGTEPDELIGVIRNQTSLNLTSSYFSYLTSSSPSITVAVTPSSVSEDGTTNLVYTFTRTGSTTNSLTINYSVGGTAIFNTDYTQTGAATFSSTTGTITFAAGATTATLTVDPTADTVFEDNETVNLTLATGNGYVIGTPNTVTGTINNDDSNSVISINDVTVVEGKDANALLTVSVSNPNAQDIRVNYTTAPLNATADTDYTSQTGILIIPANSLTATISIPLINDSINETNEAFTVTLSNPINATLNPDASFGEVTITDTLQSSVNRILPSGVENLTLTGTGNINGTGNTSNNILIGNTANNILTGAAGKDTLTGGTGIDKFGYKTLTDSLLANYDLITDFNATTGNDLFLVTTARAGFTTGLTVSTLDATGIGTALTTTNFAANFAAQFTFTSGTTTRTFVAINDAIAGFNASTDSIVEVTGLTGTLVIGNFVTA